MLRITRLKSSMLSRLIVFLAAFVISLVVQTAVGQYQTAVVIEPMKERTDNIQRISQFLSSAETCVTALSDYRWDYGDAQELVQTLKTELSSTARLLPVIDTDLHEVSEEYYLLAGAVKSTYRTLSQDTEQLIAYMEDGRRDEASELYYDEVKTCGEYLVKYTRELLERGIYDNDEKYAELDEINGRLKRIHAVISAAVLLLGFLMLRTMVQVFRAILSISRASKEISEGNFEYPDLTEGAGEIGQMGKAFNEMKHSMSQRVELLNEKNRVEHELYKKETEALELQNLVEREKLQHLRTQINPHFLFNTLNVIMYTAQQEGASATKKLIESLSRLFRYALASNESEVPVAKEVQIINALYSLYRARFGEKVTMEWHIPKTLSLTETLIPSFMIQPLVENAFNHGISRKEEGGHVDVFLEPDGDQLIVRVADNGAGMDPERLARVQEELKTPSESGDHIGLYNVAARLKLRGEQYGLSIQSKEGSGTEVIMRAPMFQGKKGDEEDDSNSDRG